LWAQSLDKITKFVFAKKGLPSGVNKQVGTHIEPFFESSGGYVPLAEAPRVLARTVAHHGHSEGQAQRQGEQHLEQAGRGS
jgi:hypothetical protein